MIRKQKILLSAGVAVIALVLAGCSAESTSENTNSETAAVENKMDSVALMVSDLSNPFFASMETSLTAQAEAEGFALNVQDGRQDLNAQNEQIDAFIQQGVDILLLNAVDSAGIQPAVERAIAAGMVVIAVGDKASGAQAVAAVNNTQAGSAACEFMAEQMGGKGEVAIIDGTAVSAVQERVVGCLAALGSYPDIKIVAQQNGDNSIGKGQIIGTDILTAHPNLGGIFGINDPTALGALLAAEDAGFTNLVIVGVDGSPAAVAELQKADSMFFGTATQDPGAMALEGLIAGKTLFSGGTLSQTDILLDSQFVNRANLSEYTPWG
jgi:ribose transport system substrate-binding protein